MIPRREVAEYKLRLKGLSDGELFAEWSRQYDAGHVEHVMLVIAEMDVRASNGAIKL